MLARRWRRATWRTLFASVLLSALLFPVATGSRVSAGGLSPSTTTLDFPPPPLLASAAALMDADTGQWLYEVHADRPLPMASTTKIMTALLAIEHGHLDDLVPVSRAAASVGETTMGLVAGERVRMRDMLYGLMLPSGNDAAIAIAEHVAGSQAAFVAMMNARATSLHLTHTHYVNSYGFVRTPDGDDPSHYTSAHDLVLLARQAMQNALFRTIVSTKSYTVAATKHNRRHDLSSINYFLYWYPGADGVKPGWTSGAGICQVVDARRHGRHLIAAVLNTPNLFTDVRDVLNYGFGDFTWYPSGKYGDTTDQHLTGGTRGDPSLYFPYTGHSVRAAFLQHFEKHGGINVFGLPRTQEVDVDGDREQFFTNQVLSYDARAQIVIPLRLGLAAVPSPSWLTRLPRVPDTSWRTYFPQTGHTITYLFRSFYLKEGGPATFGYPLTEKRFQGSTLMQYFENAVFVWHQTSAGGYIGMVPLGEQRLKQLGFLPGVVPPNLHIVPARQIAPRPTATPSSTMVPTLTPLPTASPTPFPSATQRTPITRLDPTPTASIVPPSSTPTAFVAQPSSTPTASVAVGRPTSTATATAVPQASWSDTPVPPGTPPH